LPRYAFSLEAQTPFRYNPRREKQVLITQQNWTNASEMMAEKLQDKPPVNLVGKPRLRGDGLDRKKGKL